MEKIGVVFGCFIPLHRGHLKLIEDALRENDIIILGICGSTNDRGKDFITFSDRCHLLWEKYKNNPRVYLVELDDDEIGLTGKFDIPSWSMWARALFDGFQEESGWEDYEILNAQFTWYTGELNYVEKLSEILRDDNFKYYGRQATPISGTKIRGDYKRYRCCVDEDFRKYLDKKFDYE